MSSNPPSCLRKLLAIVIAFAAMGFLGASYLLGVGYCDDRTQLIGNHPTGGEMARSTGKVDPEANLNLQIRFALRHRAALERLLAEQHNSKSANYRKWLKTGEFSARFGPSKAEVKTLTDWLADEGFNVTNLAAGHVEFSGSVAQAQRTFAVTIARFGNGGAYGNATDPFIPARFANTISAVTGMDNMVHAAPVSWRMAADFNPAAIVGGAQTFGPNDVYSFYDENPGPGKEGNGDCVAVVGLSDFVDSAMTEFNNQFGLPPMSYTRVLHGANPGINGAEVETELDMQWVHAAAPAASIVFHLGGYLVDDIGGAVSDNQCGAISISYGFCGPSAAFINGVIHPLFQQAAAQGQSVFVSSGDQGAAGLGYNPYTNSCVANDSPSVNEMSADPEVTSVGGTQFNPKYAGGVNQGYTNESTWNDVSGATGGGASQVFAKPDYQTGPGVPDDGARDVPDVSLMASPNAPGAFVGHDMGGGAAQVVCCVGGTSLSTPLWAAFSRVVAEIAGQTRLGNFNTIIYQLANQQYATAGFHDVTVGDNGYHGLPGFNAGPGYDQATGWGTVDFEVFANAAFYLLNPTAAPTPAPTIAATPTATPTPAPPSGGVLNVPAAIKFPATATGRPGAMKTLVIRNLSRTSPLSVEVGTLAAPFTVSTSGHYVVAPASSVSLSILFSPVNCGTATQSLQVISSDPKHPQFAVRVTAAVKGGKLSMPAKVSLSAPLSTVATKTVMLKNSGSGMLSGTAQSFDPNSPFTLLGGAVSFWLAPGKMQPITIQFKAASSGSVKGNLVVAMAEPAGTASMSVSGSAK